ncbi:hypothetical protein L484_000807 [Morus notabilis]|uniref:THH1/TOM1/TOM3 domain-containing protein n=1 Tax=Morus notabilis TaxID=981085 RepID=W9REK7_9ROSA|nr:hypothetical protein L484_000807 [Morus notabilis]
MRDDFGAIRIGSWNSSVIGADFRAIGAGLRDYGAIRAYSGEPRAEFLKSGVIWVGSDAVKVGLPTSNAIKDNFSDIWTGSSYFGLIGIALWFISWWKPIPAVIILSKIFFAGVSLFAALGFLLYGGRLFLMLQRFPVESKGRRKKLQEVGYVTTICFSCFLIRCIMVCLNVFDKAADLDVLDHPILNLIYYLLVEILPSCLVLFILRKLPPKRGITQYHPIR